ncbi:MAG: DUF1549 domain-containing protein [Pirellulales bacterium]
MRVTKSRFENIPGLFWLVILLGAGFVLSGRSAEAAKPNKDWKPPASKLPKAVTEKPDGPVMKVAPLDRSARRDVEAAAAKIDSILKAYWQEHKATPGPKTDDHEFVRRAYLELAGRIPTIEEAESFCAAKGSAKRGELIDDLLESPGYVSHFYNFWADILRLQERPSRDVWFEPYMAWVKESVAANRPYDEWVFEMLTATGRISENPAAGFQLRDVGTPLVYLDNTVRVFLGTQIGCAQCHDHPFDKWTQQDFYKLAGLTNGTRYSINQVLFGDMNMADGGGSAESLSAAATRFFKNQDDLVYNVSKINYERGMAEEADEIDRGSRDYLQSMTKMVSNLDTEFRLPYDYRYDDAQPLDVIEPAVLWDEVPSAARNADKRTQFGAWLTSRDNRQFARTIANRMWKKMMGVGLVEPIDDFQEGNIPAIPELLEHLTDEMLRLDFDLREFVRIVASTDVYQRLAVEYDATAEEPYRYTAPALKRLTAEQLWDSLLTLIAVNEWAYQRPTVAELAPGISIDISSVNYQQFVEAYETYKQISNDFRGRLNSCTYKGLKLVRASELPQPSPANHLLRQFGQGDRQAIQTARQVATVPQILTLFNGWMTHAMLEQGSVIYDEVAKQKTMKGAVDTIFMAILTHKPTADMRRLAEQEIKQAKNPAAGCGNLIWALLNTREFMFIE